MSRRPSHPVRLLTSALAAGALLTTAACSDGGGSESAADTAAEQAAVAERNAAEQTPSGSPTGSPTGSPSASPGALTESGAKAALLTEADLEGDWNQVGDADKWRDRLLVGEVDVSDFLTAKSDASDCQQLLDGLYRDNLLGEPSGPSALTGFEQGDSRLLEQVAGYDRAGLDDRLKWMASLPQKCDEFTATDSGEKRTVQVTEASVPDVGDARQGLHVTVRGDTDGTPVTLTLDVAAVRVGTSALTVTGGGLDGGQSSSVQQGVRQGTERLQTVLAGKTPSPQPANLD
ncbi:Lipoprotein OS=Streptomyces tendae OX=1932 GN=GUR47_02870 PE=4 SV=1 [Streptomyces tendae]